MNAPGGSGSRLGGLARASAARIAPSAILTCAVLAPLAVHWLSGRTLVWFDTASLYAPQRWLVDEALRAFRLPLWNPFMGAGVPFFADAIHGVLHPLSILTAWLGTDRSADVLIGAYVACAGLGAAVLARDLGASRSASAIAAFAYGMSGYVLSMAGNLVFLAGAGSLPFCVAGLRRFAVDPRPATLAFGVAGASVVVFSGDFQASVVGGALAFALAWEAAGWRGALRVAAAGALGLLLAGVQIVPSAVHLPRSVRNLEAWQPTPSIWALEPWRIPELIVPGFLWGSNPVMDRVFEELAGPGKWIPGNPPTQFVASVAVGLLPVTLALAGVRTGRRGKLLGAFALLFLWMALGRALGASAVFGHVPIWRGFQYSEKLVGPLSLVLAVLAALGADAVLERKATARKVLEMAAAVGLTSAVVLYLESSALTPDVASIATFRVVRGALHVLLATGALGGWLLLRDRLGVARGGAGLAVLAWIGMAAASPAALRPGDPAARLGVPGPALDAKPPGPRILTPYTYESYSLERGAELLDASIREHALKGYPAHNVGSRLDSLELYSAMPPRALKLLKLAHGTRWPEAARRYAVTHVVVDPPRTEEHRTARAIAVRGGRRVDAGSGPAQIWAVPHREWASFAPEVHVVPDAQAAGLAAATTLIERSPAVIVEAPGGLGAAPGRVVSIERGLESLRVEAEAEGDATLIVADAWWPGWEAAIDGAHAPIFRADNLVRAVRWPAGRHVLEMRYRPPEVRKGLVVSAIGIALTAAAMAFLRRRRIGPRLPEQA